MEAKVNQKIKYIQVCIVISLFTLARVGLANEARDELRIFFPISEHSESEDEKPVEGKAPSQAIMEDANQLHTHPLAENPSFLIRFDSIVSNSDSIQLLVNDLPCETVVDVSVKQLENPIDINCAHLMGESSLFRLRSDGNALLVYRAGKYIAMLLVGQSL